MKLNVKLEITSLAVLSLMGAFLIPLISRAQESPEVNFEAEVLEVLEEVEKTREDGSIFTQQNLRLKGLTGKWEDKEFEFYGISEIEVTKTSIYKEGERVVVVSSENVITGETTFYVVDHVRRSSLLWLTIIFLVVVIAIGRWKGLRALISLALSFMVIMYFIVPRLLAGNNPLLIAVVGSLIILVLIIYLTEGFGKKSHIAVLSILISLLLTCLLSVIFTAVAKLTGTAQEEIMYLIGVGKGTINFKGLLLAAILVGTLGVLDDIVISQVETVRQLKKANPNLSANKLFKMAFEVGNAHLGSMINTLFLAYAGAALTLLLLFSLKEPPFLTFGQVINNEMVATEVVRTLVGSIGIALAVPITTSLATYFYSKNESIELTEPKKDV